jgi:hypothetical protein
MKTKEQFAILIWTRGDLMPPNVLLGRDGRLKIFKTLKSADKESNRLINQTICPLENRIINLGNTAIYRTNYNKND